MSGSWFRVRNSGGFGVSLMFKFKEHTHMLE